MKNKLPEEILSPDRPQDSYKECFAAILSFYDIQVDIDGLVDATPKKSDILTPDELRSLCHKLDLKHKEHKYAFSKINHIGTPTILILSSGPCLYIPDPGTGRGRFIIPGQDKGDEFDLKALKKAYTGKVISILPKERKTNVDTSHMQQNLTTKWFWTPITAFWGKYFEVIICTIFINLLALAVPLFTLNVYDRVVINFAEETLIVLTIGVLFALFFDFFFKTMRSYILEQVSRVISPRYDYELMERLIHIKEVDVGLTIGEKTNMFKELQGIKEFYASKLVPTIVDVPFFFLFTYIIYLIAPPLATVPIVTASVIFVVNFLAQIPINKYTERAFASMQNKTTVLVEMLNGVHAIRILNATGYKLLKWKIVSESSANVTFKSSFVFAFISHLSGFITQAAYVSVIFLGAYLIEGGGLTVGGLIACSIIYSRAITPVVGFSSVISQLKQSKDILKTINELFQLPHDDLDANKSGVKGPFKGKIEIKDLTYQYTGQARPALYKNNIVIQPGEHVGIIGKTGAGKTTLSKIMAGVIKPSEGNIFMDSFAYSSISDTELYRSIGYIPQDSFFFSGTIKENIFMGHEMDFSEEHIKRVIEMSGLHLVMEQSGEGLDMDIGEAGKKLSGGQRQAISIARAMIRDPQVLIFDEPTTGMDSALEAQVEQSLSKFIQGKTFVMVTHRTSLLSLIDRLIVVDKGMIVADGTKEDVIKRLSGGA